MSIRSLVAAAALAITATAGAQTISLPEVSQAASVTQSMGLVKMSIDYHSPSVKRDATDRRGKIWGDLVPFGMQKDLGYGTCTECPWRGGANENTVFTVSHDVKVEGQALKAGRYGLHFVPGKDEWTIIFSNNSTSWGSYFYDPADDALRVKVKPVANPYTEYLTYEFTDRGVDKSTVALQWEELAVPFRVSVDDVNAMYAANLRNELRGGASDNWRNWQAAARFALQNKVAPKDALAWAQMAVNGRFVGEENFTTLMTLADAQDANAMSAEALKSREKALAHASATPVQIHQYGRQLLNAGKTADAVKIFEMNAKRHPNAWPVNVGLARGYKAAGKNKEALKYAKLAVAQAPDELNRKALEGLVKELEAAK
jgi:hypothetical protein